MQQTQYDTHDMNIKKQLLLENQTILEALKAPWFYALFLLLILSTYTHVSPLVVIVAFFFSLMSVIDIKHQILPDILTLTGTVIALFMSPIGSLNALIGAATGLCVFGGIAFAYYKLKNTHGLGGGDIKLLTMIGALVGITGVPLVLLIASITALIAIIIRQIIQKVKTTEPIPFGPFLCLGSWIILHHQNTAWNLILSMKGL